MEKRMDIPRGHKAPARALERALNPLMGKRVYLRIILLAFFLLAALEVPAGPASGPATLLKEANRCRRALARSSVKMRYRHNWTNCIKKYERIWTRYPKSDEAAWALYFSGRLYAGLSRYSGRSRDLDEAVRLYRRVVDAFEKHRLADDAQYRIGEIYERQKKDPARAYVEYLKVDIKFPSGDMRPRAKKKLDQLSVVLGKKVEEKGRKTRTDSGPGMVPVKDIRHWSTPAYTRVVVDMAGSVKYDHHLLKADPDRHKPRRLYLDLKRAYVTAQIDRQIAIKDGLLQRARAGQYDKSTVRVVLDIESIESYKVFHLHDPFRIVVDVRKSEGDEAKGEVVAQKKTRPVRKGIRRSKTSEAKVSLARQLGLNVKTIVIDPGHGGRDPGCLASGGIEEKDIVLSLARILAEQVQKKLGCEVYLTRDGDKTLSLEKRTAIANMRKADLFVSLHINAHKDSRISGVETYFLNMATDERAVLVAARENATSEKNISDLQTILNDLMLNTKINESNRLAHEVQKGIVRSVQTRYKRVRSLGVKQAPFYVLIGAQMPAILIETGFITNATDRKRLLSRTYQEGLAEGIVAGIDAYIKGIDRAAQGG
jgi:N-acetylmuramoyl-L-alanine amidase